MNVFVFAKFSDELLNSKIVKHLDELEVSQAYAEYIEGFVPTPAHFDENGITVISEGAISEPMSRDEFAPSVELTEKDPAQFRLDNYSALREVAYPSIQDQMDMWWHDQEDSTTTCFDAIQAVKVRFPKAV